MCAVFVAQGATFFLADYQDVNNFWQYCRWLADGFLYIAVATLACILEVRALVPRVRFHLYTFAVNRLAAAVVYIWMGFFSMGGRIALSQVWEPVSHVTGILACSVGIADIFMSWSSDRSETPEERLYIKDRHQLPSDEAAVPVEVEQPGQDWPASETQFWRAPSNGGSGTSLAPTDSLKGGGNGTRRETTDPMRGMEKAENPFGETESEQATGSREHSRQTFGGLVGT